MKTKNRIFLWTSGLDDFADGKGRVGGLTVQMYFWSQIFAAHDWIVHSLTDHRKMNGIEKHKITFSYLAHPPLLAPLLEFLKIFSVVGCRPDLILVRGATRSLGILAFFCQLFHVKLVLMFSSDSNLKPEEELISRKHDRILFRWGLRNTRCFICQNELQYELLEKNYHLSKYAIIIPNVWLNRKTGKNSSRNAILWVANFRDLKRPEVFLKLAQRFPFEHFVMAGGGNNQCFENSKEQAKNIPNLEFLGPVSFEMSQKLFTEAKIYICTSMIEGFPNTFLQAFSNGIPVLTTFDPSDIVKKYQLGFVSATMEELTDALQSMLSNPAKYDMLKENIRIFFDENYSADKAFQTLLNFTGVS